MYKSFRVKNFRCFKDLQINDLGRVNLIAGRNNTGKTALLEAMYLLAGNRESYTLLRRNPLPRRRYPRDYEPESQSIASWSTVFMNFETNSLIEICAEALEFPIIKGKSSIELKISDMSDFNYSNDKLLMELLDRRFVELDDNSEVLTLDSSLDDNPMYLLLTSGNVERSRSKYSQLCSTCLLQARNAESASATERRFLKMQKAKEVPVLVKGLNIIEPDLDDLRLSIDYRHTFLEADIRLSRLIPLQNLGDGMNRMADVILAMYEATDGIIFIDEIENGLHHNIHQSVWKVINEISISRNVQVFATTHSLEMIRAAYEAFSENNKLNEFRYHRLYRSRNTGDLAATTYNELDLDAVATFDFDFEVRG